MNNPTIHLLQEHLTTAQAAPLLGMSERTLRRHAAVGRIEAIKASSPVTGSAWFIPQATVSALRHPRERVIATDKEEQEEAAPCDDEAMPRSVAHLLEQVEVLAARAALLEERITELESEDESLRPSQTPKPRAWWSFPKRNK